MNYEETIEYLYRQLPMFSRVGAAAYKEDLDNTIALCHALGNPQNEFRSIHIAGTNGKGSTSHMLAAILQQAGYKTGLYTSPHLKDFRERIRINGEMISKEFVVDFVEHTKLLCEDIQPSFFEWTVAMAFRYFAEQKVDVAVIETGLGGRLDSTNIITPVLSVITNIGYDHMNILGDTLPLIAAEKAGIIKSRVPVVVGEYLPETRDVFINKAKQTGSTLVFAQDEYEVSGIVQGNRALDCDVTDRKNGIREHFTLDLNGLYQTRNLCTVLAAEGFLIGQGFHIGNEQEKAALSRVKELTGLRGRWDVVHEDPLVVLDVAHNAEGIRQVLDHLEQIPAARHKLHIVLGAVKDKDIRRVLELLPAGARYYFTQAHIPRALTHVELKTMAEPFGLCGEGYEDVNQAIRQAMQDAGKEGLVMVCGSVFLVGEVDEKLFTSIE